MQRKAALNGDMSNYRCFADRYCTLTRYACGPWKEGESKVNFDFCFQKCESKPALGLCCEVCCFCQQAALINHEMVWDESAVETDVCEKKLVRLANFDQVTDHPIPSPAHPSAHVAQGRLRVSITHSTRPQEPARAPFIVPSHVKSVPVRRKLTFYLLSRAFYLSQTEYSESERRL